MNNPQQFSTVRCQLGEGCLWNADEQRLYWVDIKHGTLYAQAPGETQTATIFSDPGEQIGGYTFQEDGSILLFRERCRIQRLVDGEVTGLVFEGLDDEADSRFNDLIADPKGRVFCGTMATDKHDGKLYRLDPDGSIRPVVEGVGVSNGLGFNPARDRMYYIDSRAKTVDVFDYDIDTGNLSNRQTIADLNDEGLTPDGMTVDTDGDLYVAIWGGHAVRKYSPQGELLQTIEVPQAPMVTCCCFGGTQLTDLYITTGGAFGLEGQQPPDTAGYTLIAENVSRGTPEFKSRINL